MVLGLIWIILKSVSPPPPLGGQWGDTHTVSSHHPLLSLSTPTIPMPSLSPPLPYPPHHRGVVTLPSAPAHDCLSPLSSLPSSHCSCSRLCRNLLSDKHGACVLWPKIIYWFSMRTESSLMKGLPDTVTSTVTVHHRYCLSLFGPVYSWLSVRLVDHHFVVNSESVEGGAKWNFEDADRIMWCFTVASRGRPDCQMM